MLEIQNLRKTYRTPTGTNVILDGVDLKLKKAESLALMGESGSGKSTLLHLVGGLDVPDSGKILLDADDVAAMPDISRAELRQQKLGIVFQQFNLVPSLSVTANLAFQAKLAGKFDPVWQKHLTKTLGLEGMEQRYPEQLSGGQQQRVAIGRALASRPAIILADEPTGNLDEATGDSVLDLTLNLVAETSASLLMVTHSSRLAGRLDNQVHLSNGRIRP